MIKRILVLGGSGKVGSAICRTLARQGAQIAFTYHNNEDVVANLAKETGASIYLRCELADFESTKKVVDRAAEALGGLDALIQAAGTSGEDRFWECAGAGNYNKLQEIDRVAFDEMMAVNTRGTLAASQAATIWLQKNPSGGNILMIRSIDGIKPVPSPIHFATSTGAAKGMMESMAKELGNYNIRVNILALGILEGGASRKLGDEVKEAYLKHSSLSRFGTAEEVAEIAAWMALENTYVSGQVLVLDGGL